MSNSITFNSDGSIFSLDGTELNRAVRPATAMSDGQKARVNIGTNTSDFASFNMAHQAPPHTAHPPPASNFTSLQASLESLEHNIR